MGRPRSAPALLLTVAIVTLVVSIVGLVGSIMVNAFALDKYDAYGEVPIPGAATLHLPAGEVAITLHTYAVGAASGGGLPIPELGVSIDPPPGVADPDVVENIGATTSVNNDIRRRVWIAHIPAEGTTGSEPTARSVRSSSRGWPSDTDRRWVGCHGCSVRCWRSPSPTW